jgi:hypothetical protein
MDRYAKGVLYIWTIPENFNDLYALPPQITAAIKNYVMHDFPIRVDGPAQVALFAYDNNTFIVESYLPAEADVNVSVTGDAMRLKNLVTGGTIEGQLSRHHDWDGQNSATEDRVSFKVHLLPHSYLVFCVEK